MTEPSQSILTARYDKAKRMVSGLLARDALTYMALEDALQGLSLEQRLEIKRGLATAGQMP